ncbi:serine/threonine protein kinase [Parasedimentitalea psychrophila]|uniref:Serine/threonine-protein kinase n=1 Tax=Parasedimentitalea psychrophila TaxID=2997337 RepID=A0A9Y2KZ88_9RHOB|nr:serine/threonine-protein kinase [Parasedimentitalea psychrophila]WIY25850.1 serine/threonine-protein kinase [Parasedimentitalea psychrophila]
MLHNDIADNQHQADELQCGFKLLHGQYQIESALSSGGFGITYLARDSLDRQVVIKECFPAGVCHRSQGMVEPVSAPYARQYKTVLRHFLREAQWLARSVHPGIVGIHQVFRENNTAYIAMEFVDGVDLVTLREQQPERVTDALLQDVLEQALGILAFIHELGILHRDISPDNFLLSPDGTVTLIDFGAASGGQDDGDGTLDPMLSVKDGYSAHELYQSEMPHRASSDLYSLGATLSYLVTSAPPPISQHRLDALTAGDPDPCLTLSDGYRDFNKAFLASIDKALSVLPGVRYQSALEWLDELQGDVPQTQAQTQALAIRAQTRATRAIFSPDVAPLKISAELENMLASLVENTNSGLVPAGPETSKHRQAKRPQIQPDQPAKPRQLVDIFGDPIGDVDLWLQEQDSSASRTQPMAPPAAEAGLSAPQPEQPRSRRRSPFAKFILFPLRRIFGGAASQRND